MVSVKERGLSECGNMNYSSNAFCYKMPSLFWGLFQSNSRCAVGWWHRSVRWIPVKPEQ